MRRRGVGRNWERQTRTQIGPGSAGHPKALSGEVLTAALRS